MFADNNLILRRASNFSSSDNEFPFKVRVDQTKKAKVFRNNSDNTVVAEINCGLKGGRQARLDQTKQR